MPITSDVVIEELASMIDVATEELASMIDVATEELASMTDLSIDELASMVVPPEDDADVWVIFSSCSLGGAAGTAGTAGTAGALTPLPLVKGGIGMSGDELPSTRTSLLVSFEKTVISETRMQWIVVTRHSGNNNKHYHVHLNLINAIFMYGSTKNDVTLSSSSRSNVTDFMKMRRSMRYRD